ncbi:hypothetical protein XENORESO_003321 [Xenotaenia resolanae]|uniref:Uncharacterized protein n=1 Tax=Xenotaenia resolanae TaxID=208358 RepID=A0ABV0X3I4_9TELE
MDYPSNRCLYHILIGLHTRQVLSPSQGNTETHMTKKTKTDMHMPKGDLKRPGSRTVMFLVSGKKSEYPERTHICTGRTCKPNSERTKAGIRIQYLLATRQQC